MPIGIVFPENSFAPAGVPLLPTQLFSSAGDFLIAFVLIRMTGKMRYHGDVGALYLMLYGIGRFCVEFYVPMNRGTVRADNGTGDIHCIYDWLHPIICPE